MFRHNLDDFQCHILLELDFHFILLQCQKLESVMIFLILTQIFLIITSSLFQHPFLMEVLECTQMKQCITRLLKEHQKNEAFHPLWIELQFPKQSNIICGVIIFIGNIIPWIVSQTILKKLSIAIALQENRFVFQAMST